MALTANQQDIWQLAQQVGADLGIAPSILWGQWTGAENGPANAGRLVPASGNGAYNLAGLGYNAGTKSYTSFSSLQQFGAAYENVIKNNFPRAVGAGSSAEKFVQGLTNGAGETYYGSGITAGQYLANLVKGQAGAPAATGALLPGTTISQWTPTPLENLEQWMDNTFGTHFYSTGLGGDSPQDVSNALNSAAANGTPNTPAFNSLQQAYNQEAASQAGGPAWWTPIQTWLTGATHTAGLYLLGGLLVVLGVVFLVGGNKTVQEVVKEGAKDAAL